MSRRSCLNPRTSAFFSSHMKSSSDEVLTNFIFGISRRGVKVALDQWLWIEDQDLSSYDKRAKSVQVRSIGKIN